MRHFYRTQLAPAAVMTAADTFFRSAGFDATSGGARTRAFGGALGAMQLSARPEGGHYTFVEANTDQMGESRMDRNVKRFFVHLRRLEDPRHALEAAY
jgi:hypothetical protein